MPRSQRIAGAGLPHGIGLGLRWEFLEDALDTLERDGALPGVDFFEISPENYMRRGGYFPDALHRVRERAVVATHGLTMSIGGTDPLGDAYMSELKSFLDIIDPPFHTDHLCFCGAKNRMLHDLIPLPISAQAARHAAARVRQARDRLERPMAVENISYYFLPGAPPVGGIGDAAFIGDVVEQADCGLLFDVNNLYVNAQNHGLDVMRYLDAMPWDRVVQLHIAGHERVEAEDLIIDTHGAPVVTSVLELLTEVVRRTGPVPVLLERDNNVPELPVLLDEIQSIRAAYERGLEP